MAIRDIRLDRQVFPDCSSAWQVSISTARASSAACCDAAVGRKPCGRTRGRGLGQARRLPEATVAHALGCTRPAPAGARPARLFCDCGFGSCCPFEGGRTVPGFCAARISHGCFVSDGSSIRRYAATCFDLERLRSRGDVVRKPDQRHVVAVEPVVRARAAARSPPCAANPRCSTARCRTCPDLIRSRA